MPRPETEENPAQFRDAWDRFAKKPGVGRLLAATGIGAAAFTMQDVLLEPYGGEVLGMSVSGTTLLTAVFALASVAGFVLPARWLAGHGEPHRIAGTGALVGIVGFTAVIMSSIAIGAPLFFAGVALIGLGGGFYAVCTLIATIAASRGSANGIALGAWGAVQATCTGVAVALGGALRDGVTLLSNDQLLGPALVGATAGYDAVYVLEIILLFVTLAVIGPLAKHAPDPSVPKPQRLQVEAFPN